MEPRYAHLLHCWRALVCLGALMLIGSLPSHAGVLERALMPGAVSQAHAKYEADCESCHSSFKREDQPRLCLDCHKEVAADVAGKRGFHGRKQVQQCAECHTEHLGLDGDIVGLDPQHFDHAITDFALSGKHQQADCKGCHQAGQKHRDASSACKSCHAKDDLHEGRLGALCGDCHNANAWTEVRKDFDHSRTEFPLRGAHQTQECKACHVDSAVRHRLQGDCLSCHRKDDAHKGAMGERCDDCHTEDDWKHARFDHSKTRFPLLDAHRQVNCKDCHQTEGDYRAAPEDCASCHGKDDAHRGTLGSDCASCHDSARWTRAPRFDHRQTEFPLIGGHAKAACTGCHADPAHFRDTGKACIDCHRKDDSHKGRNGSACGDCHDAKDWKQSLFDHDKATDFVLRGAHRKVQCEACHTRPVQDWKPGQLCKDCHQADDPHQAKLGEVCSDCHSEDAWKPSRYSHDRSQFVLIGAHRAAECTDCHRTQIFADTDRRCVSCHRDDDTHRGGFGEDCARCHNARDFAIWDFDHASTDFPLTGAHQRARCSGCHQPAQPAAAQSSDCISCHARDDAHDGGFGRQCARCHTTTSFLEVTTLPSGERR